MKNKEQEIDLIAILKTLSKGRKTIKKIILIFMFIGLFIAVFSKKEFKASTVMIPQTNGNNVNGNIGGLAALAGISLGGANNDSDISPALYPQILSSIPFQKELLQTPLTINRGEKPITFEKYYQDIYNPGLLVSIKKYTLGLPKLFIEYIKTPSLQTTTSDILSVTPKEKLLMDRLKTIVALSVNKKDGFVSLTVKMPKALPSAELTKKTQELLQQYIIRFKVKKAQEQLQFVNERFIEKEKEFKAAQQKLAVFQDENQYINSALVKTKLTRLESEYDLAFSMFAGLAKQVEAQQIKVKEDTPVFTILKPVSIPIETVGVKRSIILIIWSLLGGFFGVLFIFFKSLLSRFKVKWNENSTDDIK